MHVRVCVLVHVPITLQCTVCTKTRSSNIIGLNVLCTLTHSSPENFWRNPHLWIYLISRVSRMMFHMGHSPTVYVHLFPPLAMGTTVICSTVLHSSASNMRHGLNLSKTLPDLPLFFLLLPLSAPPLSPAPPCSYTTPPPFLLPLPVPILPHPPFSRDHSDPPQPAGCG